MEQVSDNMHIEVYGLPLISWLGRVILSNRIIFFNILVILRGHSVLLVLWNLYGSELYKCINDIFHHERCHD